MFARKKRIGSNPCIVKTKSRFLRLLRSETRFQASLANMERKDREDAYDESGKEIGQAMLKAEYEKARAIMMMQQHPNFC